MPHQLHPICGKGTEAQLPGERNFKSAGSLLGRRQGLSCIRNKRKRQEMRLRDYMGPKLSRTWE